MTVEEKQIRPFADFLQEVSAGASHIELSDSLNELVEAVSVVGKGGTLTYTVKVAPAGRGSSPTVLITDEIKVKLPQADRPEGVFFIDANGNLTRDNPDQLRLPLREVPKPTIDRETGEIKEVN